MCSAADCIVAVIGGTGKTGKWALKGALQRGFKEIRVLARSPAKLLPILEQMFNSSDAKNCTDGKDEAGEMMKRLKVVSGSVTDTKALEELLTGADVVLSFLGMSKPPDWIVSPGVEAIIAALKGLDRPPKFVSMSSISLNESRAQGNKAWGCCGCVAWITRNVFLKQCFLDMNDAELKIEAARRESADSKLNIIIARGTILADKKNYRKDYTDGKPSYRANTPSDDPQGKLTMNVDRQHVAEFFLDVCVTSTFDGKNASIFEKK